MSYLTTLTCIVGTFGHPPRGPRTPQSAPSFKATHSDSTMSVSPCRNCSSIPPMWATPRWEYPRLRSTSLLNVSHPLFVPVLWPISSSLVVTRSFLVIEKGCKCEICLNVFFFVFFFTPLLDLKH